ncbi:homocitrate synthase/isopropylmalate synthase family protein [Desulfospira joergensenii]|uniref:homocitrate synthase/isopropylmalate synthase family protein n=1 Tax=Desulfospira joergensenii TaxID=53329 RepID=UPI001FC923E4|nr:hypothetical protein [Desulfospira joergensenii]
MAEKDGIRIRIADTTLRDGEQAPGVVFSTKEKLEIAESLARAGVDEIEAGIPAMGEPAFSQIRQLIQLKLPCTLVSWCRAGKEDIYKASECGTAGVHISFPVSSILLRTFNKDEAWVLEQMEESIEQAKKYFDRISLGAQDAFRTDMDFLETFTQRALYCGIRRISLADTVGTAHPSMVMTRVACLLKKMPGLELGFHGHNDLGMATANAVSAAQAGAKSLSVTVNGLGERAGNIPLEEAAVALAGIEGMFTGIDLSCLTDLSRLVSRASGRKIHSSKPIVGSKVFCHESGIHCAGLLRDSSSYQPFDPGMVGGGESRLLAGYHSGFASIRHTLKSRGISINRTQGEKLLSLVRETALAGKKNVSSGELAELYFRL